MFGLRPVPGRRMAAGGLRLVALRVCLRPREFDVVRYQHAAAPHAHGQLEPGPLGELEDDVNVQTARVALHRLPTVPARDRPGAHTRMRGLQPCGSDGYTRALPRPPIHPLKCLEPARR